MKLSEMNTIDFMKCTSKMAKPVSVIAKNPDFIAAATAFFTEHDEKTNRLVMIADAIGSLLPVAMDTCMNETIEIISALTFKTPEQIKNQRGLQTIKDVKDSFDSELIDFFT